MKKTLHCTYNMKKDVTFGTYKVEGLSWRLIAGKLNIVKVIRFWGSTLPIELRFVGLTLPIIIPVRIIKFGAWCKAIDEIFTRHSLNIWYTSCLKYVRVTYSLWGIAVYWIMGILNMMGLKRTVVWHYSFGLITPLSSVVYM